MAVDLGCCVACGATGRDLSEHHLNPQADHGDAPPTVYLCGECHGLAHGRDPMEHAAMIRKAKRRAKALGQYAGGTVPFGWEIADDGKALEEDEGEQEILREIRRARSAGESFRGIAQVLNGRGVPTKTGKQWTHTQVARAIRFEGVPA